LIVGHIRLPRVLLAALIGAILGMSGAATQGLFRNPLADPSLIGVTAGASLGAALIIVLGGNVLHGYTALSAVSAGAFAGGAVAVLFVYRLATSPGGTSVATMLLAGIAITALAGALGSLLEFHADNDMLRRISLWKMGGMDGANYPRLLVAAVVGAAMLLALPRYAATLNALLLGESEARHLGVDVDRAQLALITWVAIGVGTSVALAGTIAFVGLVVPHMVRMVAGPDHRVLLPASALAGAILLLVADTLSRIVLAPTELPVGIVTAIIGVPFFVSLLRKRHHYGMQA
jgi:iron complex transport system permease protein